MINSTENAITEIRSMSLHYTNLHLYHYTTQTLRHN
jgi:hypothetical protein